MKKDVQGKVEVHVPTITIQRTNSLLICSVKMGGSASMCCALPSRKVVSAFVDETLLDGESILKVNAVMRKNFVEYMKGDEWLDSLISFEDAVSIFHPFSEAAWKRFGYKTPHSPCSKSVRPSLHLGDSSKSLFTVEPNMDELSISSQLYSKMVMNDCYTAISSSQLFLKEELRSILIAALLPLFFKSTESAENSDTKDNSGWNSDPEECTVDFCAPAKHPSSSLKRPKTQRLQELLLGAAAMFDSSELEAYLSDLKASWLDDYLKAIHSLPVTVTLSAVDCVKEESKIVYANDSRCGFFGCKSQVGENIHEVYSENSLSSNATEVANAVFTAQKFKRSLQEANGMCRLRALKPVHDATGKHVYVLGLESYLFEDPFLQGGFAELSEKPFQQVDDLLLILPMLVRNFNTAELLPK